VPELHPAASEHAPFFVTNPGETDGLFIICGLILVLAVLGFGIVFFRLHSLPEQIAHKGHKLQFELVAVLALISLFTHEHIFWIIALLLAFIDLPDFGTPLNRIAGSAEKMAGIRPGEGVGALQLESATGSNPTHHAALVSPKTNGGERRGDDSDASVQVRAKVVPSGIPSGIRS
jgi:hypothetical protein